MKKLYTTLVFISSLPLIAAANVNHQVSAYNTNPADAQKACIQALRSAKEHHAASLKTLGMLQNDCKYSERTVKQWTCVETGVKNGNSLNFTMTQCFKKSGTGKIMVGIGEEKKTFKKCEQVTQYSYKHAEKKPRDYSFLCKLHARNTQDWTCMKNLIEKQGKNFPYAANQCFKD